MNKSPVGNTYCAAGVRLQLEQPAMSDIIIDGDSQRIFSFWCEEEATRPPGPSLDTWKTYWQYGQLPAKPLLWLLIPSNCP